ncbi:hypothetical protein Caci_2939 [Catenulispora acidiphila DSM 44928]|uniref:Uncharacterized protein n=1 Tax=Catenulispora acidiphila (strain DSM 44928 / JCM 14897 / NBRC 102108 / NRRL B-24433 / ID139908) TaxID=479433 RepID=C7Q2V6_CATAD|nr:hypothetical protein [Catenulispora acidiphila]ACU71848.1 hypothetical protein Caci_2939 [Catenulispora acidiphila DSM 44928]
MALWLTAIVVLGIIITAALAFRFFDRKDMRRTDLLQDAIAAANGDPRAAVAITALIELEYGGYGREHLRLITELAANKARLELARFDLKRLQAGVAVQQKSVGSLQHRLLETSKRWLP